MGGRAKRPSYAELAAIVVELRAEVLQLKTRIVELEKKNPTPRLDESYSMKADEKRRQQEEEQKSGKSRPHGSHGDQQASERRGRKPSQEKIDQANVHELVLPEGFNRAQCTPSIDRPVWRIRDGKAILVVYEIYRGPNGEQGSIDGVKPLTEFGLEIHVAVAFLVSIVGLSMDKVCSLLKFFWQLELSKSQADTLLNQLSRHWTNEFESLCQLLAVSAVVHTDETSWSQNSAWAFLSEKSRVLIFGCRKDASTLAQILPKDSFTGIIVSDDAAIYQGFSLSQKCWAHLLRKAIRYTLLDPNHKEYDSFLKGLLSVYRKACKASADQRLKDAGRTVRVAELVDELSELCVGRCGDANGVRKWNSETEHEFDNLAQEVSRLMCNEELFTFVLHPEVESTNNEAERSLRSAALDRKTGRTTKTLRGAQRRTILVSVLESLKLHLAEFTLTSVQAEVESWWKTGESLFSRLAKNCGLDPPTESRINNLIPIPIPSRVTKSPTMGIHAEMDGYPTGCRLHNLSDFSFTAIAAFPSKNCSTYDLRIRCYIEKRSQVMGARLIKTFVSTAVLVFFCGMLVVLWTKKDAGTGEAQKKPTIPPVATPDPIPNYAVRLIDAGWNRHAAESVVELNSEWFAIQAEENPAGLELQLKLLDGLAQHSTLARFISEHPETAGLLAAADDPKLIAAGLDSANENYQIAAGLFVQHAAPHDAADIAEAMKANHDLICTLHRRGLLGCEVLFIFDRRTVGAEEYETWLSEAIQAKSAASDTEFASFVNLAMRHGAFLRKRLEQSGDFRHRFRTELWPRLVRAVDGEHGMFELYLDEERVWDLLSLANGEELLRRCGLLPIDLLYGNPEIDHPPYPEALHDKIVQMILRREDRTIHALMKFRHEPLFRKFMERDLSSETLSAALSQLFDAGPNYPEKLALYTRLDDLALADEVGPPTSGIVTWIPFYYTVYEVPKKLLQGRDPSGMDIFSAVIDPVFLVVDIASGGSTAAGRKALIVGGKEAASASARKLAEKGGEKLLVTTLRDTGLELARKQVGKEVAEKMGEKELINWTITGTLSEMQQAIKTTIGRATTFEITRPVQFMFQYSRVGRESWKRFTGMEARLFMRGDAKVYVRIAKLAGAVVGSRSAAFFERTAQDLTLGSAVESETGQSVLHGGVKTLVSTKEQLRAWQQNVSAWWLLNASQSTGQVNLPEYPRQGE